MSENSKSKDLELMYELYIHSFHLRSRHNITQIHNSDMWY